MWGIPLAKLAVYMSMWKWPPVIQGHSPFEPNRELDRTENLQHPADAQKNPVSRALLSRTVGRLENRGLVVRAGGARTRHLKFTQLGREVAEPLERFR